jgi:FkbM family methyltransferase
MEDLKFLAKKPSLVFDNILNLRAKLSYGSALHETFISQDYKWLLDSARPNTTAIDIGAFIGDTAIYLAQSKNIKRVLAFEPNPKSFSVAKENIGYSPIGSKIRISNEAIGEEDATARVSGTGLGYSKLAGGSRGKSIRIRKLDEVLKGLRNVIIKCDVEGYEVDIFRHAELRNVYAIQMEYHDTKSEMLDILQSKHFEPKVRGDRKGVIYRNVGYICAKRKP